MLNFRTISHETFDVLIRLMDDLYLKSFYLVGGTSLALQLGHRVSVDNDLFSIDEFNEELMVRHSVEAYTKNSSC